MKKAILLLLFVCINSVALVSASDDFWKVSDKTINITATVGVPFVIDPKADLVFVDKTWLEFEYEKTITPEDANGSVISNTETISCTQCTTKPRTYNVYTITPTKTGTFTMLLRIIAVRLNRDLINSVV